MIAARPDRVMNEATDRSPAASSEPPGGGLRGGSADRTEPGLRPEGGSGLYLTVLRCSLDLNEGRSRRAAAR